MLLTHLKNHKVKNIGNPALSLGECKHLWLDSQGGRTEEDVFKDKEGEYVLMIGERHLKGKVKVYLPRQKELGVLYSK